MAILTATEVTTYSNITCSAGTITAKNLIPVVQARITTMLNNFFVTDLCIETTATFDATAGTITVSGASFIANGFASGDEIFIYNSYRNDGYKDTTTITDYVITVASATSSVKAELSGRTCFISVVQWPLDVKMVAAQMCAFDYDSRNAVGQNIKSRSLGPLSETYTDADKDEYGYPKKITAQLDQYRVARVF